MRERATAASFLPLVVAAGLVTGMVGVAGLAIPVEAHRFGDEGTRPWDCGTPAAFVVGRSSYNELRPVVVGTDAGLGKAEACRAAMAPRLGLTTWAFGAGLATTLLLGGVLLAASAWTPRAGRVALIVVMAAGALALGRTQPTREVAACDVLPAVDVARVLGAPLQGRAFEPDGGARDATGCSYGTAPGVHMTVFSVAPGGKAFAGARAASPGMTIAGPGFQAYVGRGPRERSESLVVLRGDQYVNVLVYEAPPGTAVRLAPMAARGLVEW